MSDLISRQDAIDAADEIIKRDTSGNNDVIKAMTAWKCYIQKLPSADRPTGKWIRKRIPITGAIEHRCSRCDTPYYMLFVMEMNYCPNCGVKMEVEHEHTD